MSIMNNSFLPSNIGSVIKERFTEEVDKSASDLSRYIGISMADADFEFYTKPDFTTRFIGDWKHNGIYGNSPKHTINLRENSIEHMRHKAAKLECPAATVITFTKLGEQPHPMFFVIPVNLLCFNLVEKFCQVSKVLPNHLWMTPKRWAEFVVFSCGKTLDDTIYNWEQKRNITIYEIQQNLPTIHQIYKLPKILCNQMKPCQGKKCYYCSLTNYNNERLYV